MSFNGNQYPNFADKVISARGDIIRGNSSGERARYGIGAANTVLTSDGTDPAWAAHGGVPTTTKGDISGFSTTQARIPISTNNFSLYGDSSAALGLKWAASSTSTLSVTGDLLAASAANVLTRIAGGASGEILTGNGAGVLPTFQAAAGGGAWENLGSVSGIATELTLDVADHDIYMLYYNVSCDASAGSGTLTSMQINGASDANYRSSFTWSSGGAFTTTYNTGATMWTLLGAELWNYSTNNMYGYVYITKPLSDSMEDWIQMRTISANMSPTGTNYWGNSFGSYPDTSVSSIQMLISTGVNIQGAFTVNAMDLE